jgi:hypothetical protein
MKTIAACLLILGALGCAHSALAAEVYKCTVDGKIQYQGKPCEGSGPLASTQPDPRNSLVGCYTTPMKGMEEGIVVRRGTNSPYELVFTEGKKSQALALKPATTQELQQISSAFGVDASEGLSVKWPPDTPNQKPVGLYRGRDRSGKEVVLAYFFFDSGFATKTPCK